jgi:hypothetical protein
MADCSHELHVNKIEQTFYGCMRLSHDQNRTFIIVNKTAFVIDSTNYINWCPECYINFKIYVYGTWPDVRASFDGVTDLPICATVSEIEEFIPDVNVCSEPRFGKNFIYGASILHKLTKGFVSYFLMYCLNEDIKGYAISSCRRLFVNDKPAVSCCNVYGEFILIDSDGLILETEVIHSPTGNMFKIGNGYLFYERDESGIFWIYTSAPALNTKPAAASAIYADE